MTKDMKDKMVEGDEFIEKVKAYNLRSSQRVQERTPKRQHPGEREITDSEEPMLTADETPTQPKKIVRRNDVNNKTQKKNLPQSNSEASVTQGGDENGWQQEKNAKKEERTIYLVHL